MKYVFIVNNAAGGAKKTMPLVPRIEAYFSEHGGSYEIAYTKCKGDATEIARRICLTGEKVRIYSCGGDGTLHEVINGAYGFKNAEIGAFPCGTGNDYVASYGAVSDFMDIDGQVKGSSIEADLICTDGIYSINQCSMGFDAAVADNVRRFKQKPFISGSMAYIMSVVYTLAGKIGNRLTIYIDDREPIEGNYLFAIAAKGNYQGGGMMSAPDADPTSRTLNFVLVREVSKIQFVGMFNKYIKGRHDELSDVITSTSGSTMRVVSRRPLPVVLDGEIIISDEITSKIVPKAIRFILPSRVAAKNSKRFVPTAKAAE